MKSSRSVLLVTSTLLMLSILGGGLAVKVGAEENSYRQAVVFAEILALVLDNYVDEVQAQRLLEGAYEGLLAGLDANGAYLTAEEVAEWKQRPDGDVVSPGLSVLKGGPSLQVVAVFRDSPADQAGVGVGDQVRLIDGRSVNNLSLAQCRRLLEGEPGSTVKLELLRREDDYEPYIVELSRSAGRSRSWKLEVKEDVGVLELKDLRGVDVEALAEELDDLRSRGFERLLLDLRNASDGTAPDAVPLATLFADTARLVLKNRGGEVVRSAEGNATAKQWNGEIAVLVNGATAGAAEALALLLQAESGARIFGEKTFGLGAESDLLELDDGSGLLVSVALWETAEGASWNEEGITPDREVRGSGNDYAAARADQLEKVLELLDEESEPEQVEAA